MEEFKRTHVKISGSGAALPVYVRNAWRDRHENNNLDCGKWSLGSVLPDKRTTP